MRNPSFLLAAAAALVGMLAVGLALLGAHGPYTPFIVGIASFITLGAMTTAIRLLRRHRG